MAQNSQQQNSIKNGYEPDSDLIAPEVFLRLKIVISIPFPVHEILPKASIVQKLLYLIKMMERPINQL